MTSLSDGISHVRYEVSGDMQAVQRLLQDLPATPQLASMPDAARGIAELVLAEVLNNVVEHAFCQSDGHIVLDLTIKDMSLWVLVRDDGREMPGLILPEGGLPVLDPEDLPEGGFGWFLIRSLATNLDYCRESGANCLRFRLALTEPAA